MAMTFSRKAKIDTTKRDFPNIDKPLKKQLLVKKNTDLNIVKEPSRENADVTNLLDPALPKDKSGGEFNFTVKSTLPQQSKVTASTPAGLKFKRPLSGFLR
jgi:hypothetical protein